MLVGFDADGAIDVGTLEVALPQPGRFEHVPVGIDGSIVWKAFDLIHASPRSHRGDQLIRHCSIPATSHSVIAELPDAISG